MLRDFFGGRTATLRGPHIFGATDSPSCTNFCLKRAAEDRKGRFSDEAVSAVDKDFYVDDFVKSVRTVSETS